jgi:hypothetical protein
MSWPCLQALEVLVGLPLRPQEQVLVVLLAAASTASLQQVVAAVQGSWVQAPMAQWAPASTWAVLAALVGSVAATPPSTAAHLVEVQAVWWVSYSSLKIR